MMTATQLLAAGLLSDLGDKGSHWQHIRGVWDPLYSIFFTFSLDLVAACTTLLAPLLVPKMAEDYSRQHTKPWRWHLCYKSKYTSCFCSRQLWQQKQNTQHMACRQQVQTVKRTVCPPPCLSASSVSVFLLFFYSQQLWQQSSAASTRHANDRHQWPRNQHPHSPLPLHTSPCPVNGIFSPLVALATKQHNRCATCPWQARTAKVMTTPSHYHPPTHHHINPIASEAWNCQIMWRHKTTIH